MAQLVRHWSLAVTARRSLVLLADVEIGGPGSPGTVGSEAFVGSYEALATPSRMRGIDSRSSPSSVADARTLGRSLICERTETYRSLFRSEGFRVRKGER